MDLGEFDYVLPPERIAQRPLPERDASRLLRLGRAGGGIEDREFRELPELLAPGDLLVANDSRVFPGRLYGRRAAGGAVEVLLLSEAAPGEWEALARPGRKLPVGERLEFASGFTAEVVGRGPHGERRLRFQWTGDFPALLARHGHVPLPPYIHRPEAGAEATPAEAEDRERYQTVYARAEGSAAAPTAGLHFTPALLQRLAARGVEWTTVSLHVGLGTFQPVTTAAIEQHAMHAERYALGEAAAVALNRARREGRRILAVGTTAARVLETVAPAAGGEFEPGSGETQLYLYPGGRPFRALDGLLTNFHAPRSTLLMMVAAFAGLEPVQRAYQHALEHGYRFLSYGDCMLIA